MWTYENYFGKSQNLLGSEPQNSYILEIFTSKQFDSSVKKTFIQPPPLYQSFLSNNSSSSIEILYIYILMNSWRGDEREKIWSAFFVRYYLGGSKVKKFTSYETKKSTGDTLMQKVTSVKISRKYDDHIRRKPFAIPSPDIRKYSQ